MAALIRAEDCRRLEKAGVFLVALHSFLIGVMLMFATGWILEFAGWGQVSHHFFPRQSGAFHVVLATGYLWEFARYRGIGLMVAAKATAVVFLLVISPWKEAWSVLFSGVFDGVMLVGMAALHRGARWGKEIS
jgi:hypothetical protein